MVTKVKDSLVELLGSLTLAQKLAQLVSALEYGATVGGSSTVNSLAIQDAIENCDGGFILVPPGVAFNEGMLSFGTSNVVILSFDTNGRLVLLTKSTGSNPALTSGLVIKQLGSTGVLIRAVDNGVATEPILQIVDATTGDIAAVNAKFAELDVVAVAPDSPSSNKVRLYLYNTGAGNLVLKAKYPTGDVVNLAESDSPLIAANYAYDPASLADGAGVTVSGIAVAGAELGDFVKVSFSLDLQGILLYGWVSAANTVAVRFQNETGGAVDLSLGNIHIVCTREGNY